MATTLLNIRNRCRQRADMVNSQFVSDAEILGFVNASYAELYDLLIQTYEDYFVTSETFTLVTSDSGVRALAADFYKLKGVDFQLNGQYITLYPYNWNTRNIRQRAVSRLSIGDYDLSYKILGSNIRFEPRDNATGTYQLWYIPAYTALSADTDNIDSVITRNNWEEYIVIDASIKMLEKEESNTLHLEREKKAMIKRIESSAGDRDVDQPERVSDVSKQSNSDDGWYE